jgi:acetyl-CoA acyltransferase
MTANQDVYLIDGCRSPIGLGHPEKGIYRDLRADELAAQVLLALLDRNKIDPATINDFYLGCVGQHLEQGKNLARLILLLAGLPHTIPGVTINRLCASSLTALQMAANSLRAGEASLLLVGGVEHMGHVPMAAATDYHPRLFESSPFAWNNMGLTAELLAEKYGISRQDQDDYTAESNRRYFAAEADGQFSWERVPITVADGEQILTDQQPRRSSPETLAALKPAFTKEGTVTAANASGLGDGAVMALVGSRETVDHLGKPPLAMIGPAVTVGVKPERMGLGPVPAIRRLLEETGLAMDDIDLLEINEAFATQVLVCQSELDIAADRLNVRGGAVALGHPLGMTGLRLAVTLAYSMRDHNAKRGIAAMCVGHGQGVAILLENPNHA